MSQVLSGLRLGAGFSILFGGSDPNSASAPGDVRAAGLDYIYFRLGSGSAATWIYRCSVGATFQNGQILTAAIWTAK